jgi:hypothetical protein
MKEKEKIMSNPHKFATAFSLAAGLGLIAGLTPASAASLSALGLTAPGPRVEEAGYRKYAPLYVPDRYVSDSSGWSNNWGPSYRIYRHIPGGNDEIRELQRFAPETNWPPSLRY